MAENVGTGMTIMRALPFHANGHQAHIDNGALIDVYLVDGLEPFFSPPPGRCGSCGDALDLRAADNAVQVANPCPYPDGLTTVITLDVPSGKLIVSDDLRPVYNWDADEVADYNSALGQAQVTRALAKAGCAFSSIGNSCPGLYRTGPDSYIIASPGYDENDGEPAAAPGEELAGIITDLWAYSVADYAHWQARGGEVAMLGWGDTVVDVTPGNYEFTSHSGERGFDPHAAGTVIFAHIRRITPEKELWPGPPKASAVKHRSRCRKKPGPGCGC